MMGSIWESPDGRIKKLTVCDGKWGLKPSEDCECNIKITNSSKPEYLSISFIVIGRFNSVLERLLSDCLMSMHLQELAEICFLTEGSIICRFNLELVNFKTNGLIYEWDAEKKISLARRHKEDGNKLYNQGLHMEASWRFSKAIKILCSIPIEVDEPPNEVHGVKVEDIKALKTKLYNNLASCYLKHSYYDNVLVTCKKVFEYDTKNVKALYKQAIAQCETHAYDDSQKSLQEILIYEPTNTAAAKKLEFVKVKVTESNFRVSAMIKKMFEKR